MAILDLLTVSESLVSVLGTETLRSFSTWLLSSCTDEYAHKRTTFPLTQYSSDGVS